MADRVISVVARLNSVTGMSEDAAENVFHFVAPAAAPNLTDVGALIGWVTSFWLLVPTGGSPFTIGSRIGNNVTRAAGGCTATAYTTTDLTGSTPMGSPLASTAFTMPAADDPDDMPEEVAVVASFHADLTNVPVTEPNPTPPPLVIRPQQRRRGRLFVGPLNESVPGFVAGHTRPNPLFRTNIGLALEDMAQGVAANTPYEWGVWSRADADVYPVEAGWVDDAWDIQRRRGLAPTTRTPFAV